MKTFKLWLESRDYENLVALLADSLLNIHGTEAWGAISLDDVKQYLQDSGNDSVPYDRDTPEFSQLVQDVYEALGGK